MPAAEVALALDDHDEARRLVAAAINANSWLGQLHVMARAHETMADLARLDGDAATAIANLAAATEIREFVGALVESDGRDRHRELSPWRSATANGDGAGPPVPRPSSGR